MLKGEKQTRDTFPKMSWNGFQKAINRATTQIMQTTGAVEKTVFSKFNQSDPEFDQQEARFKQFEDRIEALHRECRGYLDGLIYLYSCEEAYGCSGWNCRHIVTVLYSLLTR